MPTRTNASTASPMADIQRLEPLSAADLRPRTVAVDSSPPTQPPVPVDQSTVSASVRLEAVFMEEQKAELARLLRDAVRAREADPRSPGPAPTSATRVADAAAPTPPASPASSGRLALPGRRRSAEVARIRAALDQKVRESEALARRMARPDGLTPGMVVLPRKGPRNSLGISIAEIEAEASVPVPVGQLALRDAVHLPVARPAAVEQAPVPAAPRDPVSAPPGSSPPGEDAPASSVPPATSIMPFMPELSRQVR